MDKIPLVSVIIPARNEENLIRSCLESLKKINYPKDRLEIIVADAMSADKTRLIAESFGAKVVENENLTVAAGRNKGFFSSKGEFVAFTDADCIFDKEWLNSALKYLDGKKAAGAGGPSLSPEKENTVARAVKYIFLSGSFVSGSVQASVSTKSKRVKSIPGCNSVYKREALVKVMPVDETLITCDDTEMNYRLLDKGYELFYAPEIIVWHWRRDSLKKFFKQIFRYAQGRIQLERRRKFSLEPVHIFFGLSVPLLLFLLILNQLYFLFAVFTIFISSLFFFFYVFIKEKSLKVSFWAFLLCWIFIFAWSLGFLKELFFSSDK